MNPGYERIRKFRHAAKARLITAFGGKCGRCGYNKCTAALQCHHIDPSKKEFTISQKIRCWSAVVTEARKCVCLCGNCHSEYHSGLWNSLADLPRFDERYAAVEITQASIPRYCKICGVQLHNSPRYKYCSPACANEAKAVGSWERIDLAALLHKRPLNFSAIGRLVGVSGNAVKKRAKRLGLL